MSSFFHWLDAHARTPHGKLLNQLFPVAVCAVLYLLFVSSSAAFIHFGINPSSAEKVLLELRPVDVSVGFFLYFVTAVDYALIIGRMQVANTGARARFVMNVCTCVGCFVGVTLVLFLWGFAKEVAWLIIPILIFAAGIMIKLAFEGKDYYQHSPQVPLLVRRFFVRLLDSLHAVSQVVTFWIPELGSPKVKKMSAMSLAKWSFLLPFIIGLDDLVGYMGAMTIYNVFSLLVGIYLADVLIDMLIFVSPSMTKKIVQSALLSLLASCAFLYLAYKSLHEAIVLSHEAYHLPVEGMVLAVLVIVVFGAGLSFTKRRVLVAK